MRFVPQSLLFNPFTLLGLVLGLGCAVGPILVCLPQQRADITPTDSTHRQSRCFQSLLRERGQADERYGESVAIHGSIALVGCPQKRISGVTVGSVELFRQNSFGQWRPALTLEEPGHSQGALFGSAVAVGPQRAIVATCPGDAIQPRDPVAYVYEDHEQNRWHSTATLSMDHECPTVLLSASVALDRDTILLGQVCHDVGTEQPHGLARLFRADANGQWTQVAKLSPSDESEAGASNFGRVVALSGPRALVTAPLHRTHASDCGAAYLYREDGDGNWRQSAQLLADDGLASDLFGISAAICERTALVGAIGADSSECNSGAVYLFRENDAGQWTQVARLTPSDPAKSAYFGRAVSLVGNLAVIGAPGASDGAGAVYVFRLHETGAEQIAKLTSPDAAPQSGFGRAVATNGHTILAGAPGADLLGAPNSGAAYIKGDVAAQ